MGGEFDVFGGADGDRPRQRERLWRKPKGVEEGGWLAQGHPLILAGHRGAGPRVTEGEIPSYGTRREKSRPGGGELECLVEPMGIDLGERQPSVTGAGGRMVGGGVRSPAGFDETPRALRASNPG